MVHVMHVHFMFFVVFNNLKSSFSEDNMPEHALDIFIENATKMVEFCPLNAKSEDQTLKWHQNFAFSYTMQWKLQGTSKNVYNAVGFDGYCFS